MKLEELKEKFKEGLKNLYTKSEAERLFFIAIEDLAGISPLSVVTKRILSVEEDQLDAVLSFLDGLEKGNPYQHLLGEVGFAELKLKVGPEALIPRPETEELAYLIREENDISASLDILDIGTGTGCLALACAHFFRKSKVQAVDISEDALNLARENAELNSLDVNFQKADMLDKSQWPKRKWDLIVSNPPYIGESEAMDMDDLVKNHEPHNALFVPDNDLLVFYWAIMELANERLKEGGKVYLEINQKLGDATRELFADEGYQARLLKDLSGNDRFVVAEKI